MRTVLSLLSPLKCFHFNAGNFSRQSITTDQIVQAASSSIESTKNIINNDLISLHEDTRKLFKTERPELKQICDYYFDGSGKSTRPLIICAWARALNRHYI